MKVDAKNSSTFQPVVVSMTFETAEELHAFTDFLIASGVTKVARTLEGKSLRRLPMMANANVWAVVIQPLVKALKARTPKPVKA